MTRHCMRCGKELTDAVSLNESVGPICRGMDNDVLAQLIPADIQAARNVAQARFDPLVTGEAELPVIATTLGKIREAIRSDDAETRADWRRVIKQCEWVGSHDILPALRDGLIELGRALGYHAVAAMWEDPRSVARGKPAVKFLRGRLYMTGPKCKGGRAALKAIDGRRFEMAGPQEMDQKPVWHVPAGQHQAFRTALLTYWPAVDKAELELAIQEAKSKGFAAVDGGVANKLSIVRFTTPTGVSNLKVKTPFNGPFIDDLKQTIQSRRWDSAEKVWVTHDTPEIRAQLQKLLRRHYHHVVDVLIQES